MLGFPLLLVWLMAGAVVAIVTGAAIWQRRTTGSVGVDPMVLVAATIFGSSLLAFLVTAWGPTTLAEWRTPYLVRIVWQLGGAVFLAVSTVASAPARRRTRQLYLLGCAWVAIGLLLAQAPLLDYLEGPRVEQNGTARVTMLRHTGQVLTDGSR